MWSGNWQGIEFRVEHRTASGSDGGATLRILQDDHEWLRFDCFERGPHFHLDPSGRDEISPLSRYADNVAWTTTELRRDLAGYLSKAGLANPPAADDELAAVLTAAEAALRNPPANLDDLDLEKLKARHSEKWSTYPADVLPVWVAEMDFPLATPIREVLRRALDLDDLGYPLDSDKTGLPEAFAERMEWRFGWSPDPARVEILGDIVQSMYVALHAFADEGDGAVVQTPIYPPFLTSVKRSGRRVVENRLEPGPDGFRFDLDALREAAGPDTRLMLLCNPHNPTGRVYTRAELEGLAELALERDWVVVADEIHADLVFAGHAHIPFATLSPEIATRTITLTSATKAFNIPGLRTSIAHFGTQALQERFNGYVPPRVRGGMGLLGFDATIAAWRHAQPWLDQVVPYLEANRDFVGRYAAAHWPDVVPHLPESTYLMWLDFRAASLPSTPGSFFMRNARLALTDGRLFGPGLEGYARLNFATSRAILTDALDRITQALDAHRK